MCFEDMRMILNVWPEAERMLGELAARNGKPAPEMERVKERTDALFLVALLVNAD
jgi:hypothetical protein